MKDKPELKQDANGKWYVEGDVDYVWGNVKSSVRGDVGGTINGLEWIFVAEEDNDER